MIEKFVKKICCRGEFRQPLFFPGTNENKFRWITEKVFFNLPLLIFMLCCFPPRHRRRRWRRCRCRRRHSYATRKSLNDFSFRRHFFERHFFQSPLLLESYFWILWALLFFADTNCWIRIVFCFLNEFNIHHKSQTYDQSDSQLHLRVIICYNL